MTRANPWRGFLLLFFQGAKQANFPLRTCKEGGQRRQWQPTPVLLPGKSHGQRSLVGCCLWGRIESDRTERLHFHFSLFMHWRRKWQPAPVFLPGESQGGRSLVGCHTWGRAESDTTEATQQQQQQGGWEANREGGKMDSVISLRRHGAGRKFRTLLCLEGCEGEKSSIGHVRAQLCPTLRPHGP